VDQGAHPLLEFVAQHAVGHVDDELLVEARQLLLNRQVLPKFSTASPPLQYLLDGEGLILRNVEVIDTHTLDVLLAAADEVLEKATGGLVWKSGT